MVKQKLLPCQILDIISNGKIVMVHKLMHINMIEIITGALLIFLLIFKQIENNGVGVFFPMPNPGGALNLRGYSVPNLHKLT